MKNCNFISKITHTLILTAGIILSVMSMSSCEKSYLEKNPLGSTSEATLATKEGTDGLLQAGVQHFKSGIIAFEFGNHFLHQGNHLKFIFVRQKVFKQLDQLINIIIGIFSHFCF